MSPGREVYVTIKAWQVEFSLIPYRFTTPISVSVEGQDSSRLVIQRLFHFKIDVLIELYFPAVSHQVNSMG